MNGGEVISCGSAGGEGLALAEELARAVELTMSSTASHEVRMHAYNACESFKEGSPWCAQVGLILASGSNYSAVVRHFGLQLMEHTVKYRWNQISQPEKIFIKENAMKLVCSGGWSANHMNDALSRVVVEMAKREWPQQWPSLLGELSDACARGPRHTEVVLLILLRLVEDVATLQTLESNQRRKDIYSALTSSMAEIFAFFLRLIELHVQQFREHTQQRNPVAAEHERVVQAVLSTLTGFVEWVSMNHIISQNGRLLQILCILLSDEAFQLPAAECLLQIVNRKGQVKERKPLMILLSEEAINCIHRAAVCNISTTDDKCYLFLKKLTQVLSGIGQQLCSLWGREDGVMERPPHLAVYLETLSIFSAHPSLTLAHTASTVWSCLFKHEHAHKDPLLLSFVPRWVNATAPKLVKVSYPMSRPVGTPLDTASYAAMDFESENEFATYICRCRTDFLDNFRQATVIAPLVTFGYVDQWLRLVLTKAAAHHHTTNGNVHDPVYLEWEALSILLESVLSRILQAVERPSVSSGLSLLEMCLALEPQDPLLLSLLLSFISALFVFLTMSSCQITQGNCVAMSGVNLLPLVLDKIFGALVYTGGHEDSKGSRPRAVRNVRRHAASLLVKIGHKYPLLLLPVFSRIHSTVRKLCQEPTQLSTMERITLQEALLLISNHFCDYNRQKVLIGEILGSCGAHWAAMAPNFESASAFMRFVGLDSAPVAPSALDHNGQNRSHLLHCVNLVLGVIKRCAWPDDPDKASRGGFSGGMTNSGNPIWRNPCAELVLPILPHILALFRVLNQLYDPQAIQLLSEGYKGSYNMLEVERQNLLGQNWSVQDPLDPNVKKPQTPLERMQNFLSTLHDNCCHMLGSAGPSIGRELYQMAGIGPAIVTHVLCGLDHVPDYRLRSIVRVFLRPFISSCPPSHHADVVMPVMMHITPYMLDRLCNRWQYIMSLYESGKFEEEGSNESQEVIEDMLNRNLTREYLDVLKVALIGGNLPIRDSEDGNIIMEGEDSLGGNITPTQYNNRTNSTSHHHHGGNTPQEHVGELGSMLLNCEHTCSPIMYTILSALWWSDSYCSLRACSLVSSSCRSLVYVPPSLPPLALAAVLRALQNHGQHDANQAALLTLGVQLLEVLRPKCPAMLEVMQQIPNVNIADLHKLDEKLQAPPTKGNKIEKGKKDLFKKITSQLIGRNVGQLFRKEVRIVDLPHMSRPPKQRSPGLLDKPSSGAAIASLFTPNTIS